LLTGNEKPQNTQHSARAKIANRGVDVNGVVDTEFRIAGAAKL